MTTFAQIAANRRNARKSTGPVTLAGRQRAARNAAKHGMNQSPEPMAILDWLRTILGSPEALLENLEDPFIQAAPTLALAEAQLAKVKQAEPDFFVNLEVDPNANYQARTGASRGE
jgi:hypothetical protein